MWAKLVSRLSGGQDITRVQIPPFRPTGCWLTVSRLFRGQEYGGSSPSIPTKFSLTFLINEV